MSNQIQSPNVKNKYDLQERTAKFGEAVIKFVRVLDNNPINRPLISQIVRSSTSIGANYMEADGALSQKKILSIKLRFVKRRPRRLCIGPEW